MRFALTLDPLTCTSQNVMCAHSPAHGMGARCRDAWQLRCTAQICTDLFPFHDVHVLFPCDVYCLFPQVMAERRLSNDFSSLEGSRLSGSGVSLPFQTPIHGDGYHPHYPPAPPSSPGRHQMIPPGSPGGSSMLTPETVVRGGRAGSVPTTPETEVCHWFASAVRIQELSLELDV